MKTIKRLPSETINWPAAIPYLLMHLLPLGIFFTGVTWFSVGLCVALYAIRVFFISAGFHRYFSHRSYQVNRFFQFLLALGGTLAMQRGALWWASHHRRHHQFSDELEDAHTPIKGFFWSHMGWTMSDKYKPTAKEYITDFSKYPELQFLERYWHIPPILLAIAIYFLWGPAALFVGFFLSQVLTWHVTYCVNSLAHKVGTRRYVTNDTSRNFFLLALLTNGEGWHNNHHYYQSSARQGFFWWEFDLTFYILKLLSYVGIVRNLITPPKAILQRNRVKDGVLDIGMFEEHWRKAHRVFEKTKQNTADLVQYKKENLAQAMERTKTQADALVRTSRRAMQTKSL